jgi:ATP-dependent DNA helicase RecG
MDREIPAVGKAYIIFGKPGMFNGKAQMAHPEIELYSPEALKRKGNATLQPVYNYREAKAIHA